MASTRLLATLLLAQIFHVVLSLIDPDRSNTIAENSFVNPTLSSNTEYESVELPQALIEESEAEGLNLHHVQIDVRSGRIASIPLYTPIYPGVNNRLLWRVGPRDLYYEDENVDYSELAIRGVKHWLEQYQDELSISTSELFAEGTVRAAVHDNGNLIQLHFGRTYKNLTVVDSRAFATVKKGNLVNVGFEKWESLDGLDSVPTLNLDEANERLADWAGADLLSDMFEDEKVELCDPELLILTLADHTVPNKKRMHSSVSSKSMYYDTRRVGYKHVLAWRTCPVFENQQNEIMEGLVDAHTGEIYSFVDKIDYFTGTGSVYPLSNDQNGPDGTLQSGWPFIYLQMRDVDTGDVTSTDAGGNYFSSGVNYVTFKGKYVMMSDDCGEAGMTVEGDFDWGGSTGTDCKTPGFGGKGNTHSSRTGYYELNKIMEIARSRLPDNEWLKLRLTANMNIKSSCNAYWDGMTINFYRSGECANTGEIAGVFDHEWSHGLDNNDVYPEIVKPSGEGIADIYTALRLGDSCIGRGFLTFQCPGEGDKCIDCTGVRDIDYEKHQSKQPHTLTWTYNTCENDDNGNPSVHCMGLVYSEAVWSLWKRDLPSFYGYDDNTALEIVTRLVYIAAGNVNVWYSGSPPWGGCGGNSGYLSFLYADDDDGDITNGTPHMQAIFVAHNRQQIACNYPPPKDSGCTGTPQEAPVVSILPGPRKNTVEWTSVSNAVNYQVFRTDGPAQCSQGKVLLATLAPDTLSFVDSGLMNGREYYYIVIPKGGDDACFGPASECVAASPADEPDFQVSCQSEFVVFALESEDSTTHNCTVFALGGFMGTLSLAFDAPTGLTSDLPETLTLSSGDVYVDLQLRINLTSLIDVGEHKIEISATDGDVWRDAKITVFVFDTEHGSQKAVYYPNLGVPTCLVGGKECSSGELLFGRGAVGPELNAPNTLGDDCMDGSAGNLHDEAVNKIVVRSGQLEDKDSEEWITEDGFITITATVWSYDPNDSADFWITSTPYEPSWEYIGSVNSKLTDSAEVMEMQHKLGEGLGLKAVRVSFHYATGTNDTVMPPCIGRRYDDVDDLVFTVSLVDEGTPASPTPTPSPILSNLTLSPTLENTTLSPTLAWTASPFLTNSTLPPTLTNSTILPTLNSTTLSPTFLQTESPTKILTKKPTKRPTKKPTSEPTKRSTKKPTPRPTIRLTKKPTKKPTKLPTPMPNSYTRPAAGTTTKTGKRGGKPSRDKKPKGSGNKTKVSPQPTSSMTRRNRKRIPQLMEGEKYG